MSAGRSAPEGLGDGRVRLAALAAVALVVTTASAPGVAGAVDADGPDTDPGEQLLDDPDALAAYVDDLMAQRVGTDVPGASVAVVHDDELVHVGGYGEADVTTGEPVDAQETAFEVGSVAKLVTFTAVMQGVEDGILDLDADVGIYLEGSSVDVGDDDAPVTLRHLGTHTAGFESVANPGMVTDPTDVPSLEQAASTDDRPRRIRPPGELVNYSNFGALLAGHIVEQAHGVGFDEYVEEHIFAPLGMTHATFAQPRPEEHPGQLAASHTGGDGVFERADPVYITWRPAGSLSASATDMAAFMRAHLGGGASRDARILAPETLESMHEVHYVRHPAVGNGRYGFFEHAYDPGLIRHDGATLHDTAELLLSPADGVGVFVAFNIRGTASPVELAEEIADALGVVSDPVEPPPAGSTSDAEQRARTVAGEYRSTMGQGSGLARFFGVIGSFSLEPTAEGELRLSGLGMDQRFVETEPYSYRRTDGRDSLAVEVSDGQVPVMHVSSQPQTTFVGVPASERLPLVAALLGGALGIFLLSLVGWTVVGIRRRWRRRSRKDAAGSAAAATGNGGTSGAGSTVARANDGEASGVRRRRGRLATTTALALCLVALAWVLLLGGAFVNYGQAMALRPWPVQFAVVLPYVIAVLAVANLVGAIGAWRRGTWTTPTRVHHTLLGVAGSVLVWPLHVLGML